MIAVKRGLPQSLKSSSIIGRTLPARTFPMFATLVSNAETRSSLGWSIHSETTGNSLSNKLTTKSPLVCSKSTTWLIRLTKMRTSATHGAPATTSILSTPRLAESRLRSKARLPNSGAPLTNSTRKKARSWRTALNTRRLMANGTTILRTTELPPSKLKVTTSERLRY